MPDFSYVALAATGQKSQGVLTANTEREAISVLDSRGLMPIKVEVVQGTIRVGSNIRVSSRVLTSFFLPACGPPPIGCAPFEIVGDFGTPIVQPCFFARHQRSARQGFRGYGVGPSIWVTSQSFRRTCCQHGIGRPRGWVS